MQQKNITVEKSARYFVAGIPGSAIKEVWFVCHGYGQLAADFLKQFECLQKAQRLLVAPEGLSRFYWQGFSGKVGASWMTREDRLQEIADYVRYLDAVYKEVVADIEHDEVKVVVLGFSQGTAAVCRWLMLGNAQADRLILWAGQIPPDLDLNQFRNLFRNGQLSLVVGRQDEIAKPELIAKEEARLNQHRIRYELLQFDGGHHIEAEVLKKLAQNDWA
ncbi:MAG: alpha/beta hydrolase [bacterium]